MIVYKVVKRKKYSRVSYSCCAYGKYELEYIKGKTTKALGGTVVMCFNTIGQARIFIGQLARLAPVGYGSAYEIMKVKSIGKRIYLPFYTSLYSPKDLTAYYKRISKMPEGGYYRICMSKIGYELKASHPGTICFPAVKVLSS